MTHRHIQSLFGGCLQHNLRAVFSVTTIIEASLRDQEAVNHISASVLAIAVVLSLDSSQGSLVAVINPGQWGQINIQSPGMPLTHPFAAVKPIRA